MLVLSEALAEHLQLPVSTLAVCWRIVKKNGVEILGTEHDCDLTVVDAELGGVYRAVAGIRGSDLKSTADMSVPNMEVEGGLVPSDDDMPIPGLRLWDIESGILNSVPVNVFIVDWTNPAGGILRRRDGVLGRFVRDTNGIYRTEVLGLVQLVQQNVGETDGERCSATLGDARCKFPIETMTRTGTVTSVHSRRRFTAELDAGPAPVVATYYDYAKLTFTSGENEDFERETHRVGFGGDIVEVELWDEAPADIQIGDTIRLPPGCDKREVTCRIVFENIINIRATGIYVAGIMDLIKSPE